MDNHGRDEETDMLVLLCSFKVTIKFRPDHQSRDVETTCVSFRSAARCVHNQTPGLAVCISLPDPPPTWQAEKWVKPRLNQKIVKELLCQSQWPRGLRCRSAAARLLRSWVRIPPGAWTFVCCECCVLSGRGPCDELITRPGESY